MIIRKGDSSVSLCWGYCDRGIYTSELDFDLLKSKNQFYITKVNSKYAWEFRIILFKLSINFSYIKSIK